MPEYSYLEALWKQSSQDNQDDYAQNIIRFLSFNQVKLSEALKKVISEEIKNERKKNYESEYGFARRLIEKLLPFTQEANTGSNQISKTNLPVFFAITKLVEKHPGLLEEKQMPQLASLYSSKNINYFESLTGPSLFVDRIKMFAVGHTTPTVKINRICFRGDSRIPEDVFKTGFKLLNPNSKTDFSEEKKVTTYNFITDTEKAIPAAIRPEVAARFPLPNRNLFTNEMSYEKNTFIYVVRVREALPVKMQGYLKGQFDTNGIHHTQYNPATPFKSAH